MAEPQVDAAEITPEPQDEVATWRNGVKRVLRRQLISETPVGSLLALKRQVRIKEDQLGIDSFLDEVTSTEVILDPAMVQVAGFLSEKLTEQFSEVKGVVLLGSAVHGGKKIREV